MDTTLAESIQDRSHPSARTPELAGRCAVFEAQLIIAMGVGRHDIAGMNAWVARYAVRIRELLDTDARLLALVRAENYDAAIAYIQPKIS